MNYPCMKGRVGPTLSVKDRKRKNQILCTRTFNELSVYERKGGTHFVSERKEKVKRKMKRVDGTHMPVT